eukprot:11011112-Prorocentrum_lima.AAC.1
MECSAIREVSFVLVHAGQLQPAIVVVRPGSGVETGPPHCVFALPLPGPWQASIQGAAFPS